MTPVSRIRSTTAVAATPRLSSRGERPKKRPTLRPIRNITTPTNERVTPAMITGQRASPVSSTPATTKAIPTRSTTRPMTANGFMTRRYRPVRSTAAPDTRPSFSRRRAVLASARG